MITIIPNSDERRKRFVLINLTKNDLGYETEIILSTEAITNTHGVNVGITSAKYSIEAQAKFEDRFFLNKNETGKYLMKYHVNVSKFEDESKILYQPMFVLFILSDFKETTIFKIFEILPIIPIKIYPYSMPGYVKIDCVMEELTVFSIF